MMKKRGKTIIMIVIMVILLILRVSYNYASNILIEKGDIDQNSQIDEKDIYKIKSKIVGLLNFSNEEISLMDMNYDGKITVTDLSILRKKINQQISPESITLNKTEEILYLNGTKTLQLQATILPLESNINKDINWGSSNEEVATVSDTGLVEAVSEGEAIITATTGNGKMATCKITVTSLIVDNNIINIYISPNGNDNNDGLSESSAKQTIEAAKNLARNYSQTKDVIINLLDGEFNITEPIKFSNSDSAGEGHFVTYKGNENTIINGGVKVSDWNKLDDNCWYTAVNDIDIVNGFYVSGEEKKIANKSWNNLSGTQLSSIATFDGENGYITIAASELSGKNFSKDTNIKIIICVEWMEYSFIVDSVINDNNGNYIFVLNNDSKILLQSQLGNYASPDGQNKPVIEFKIENAYDLMDEDGEYYYDGSKLYYYSNESPVGKECVIAKSEGLIKIEGTDSKLVTNLNFENIKFKYSKSTKYNNVAFYTSQAEEIYTVQNSNLTLVTKMDGQVYIDHARDISFKNCEFTFLNATAMEIYQYAYNINLNGNKFKDIGGAAIRVGYATLAGNTNPLPSNISTVTSVSSAITPLPAGIVIDNNYIENVGTTYYAGIGIVVYYANNVKISHNTVEKVSYSGISLGWGWSNSEGTSVPTYHGNIILEYNTIKDTNKKLIDGAPIYTLGCFYKSEGKDYGCIIQHNYIDTSGDVNGYHGGIYLDEGSEFVYVVDNLILNVGNYINARSITNYESHRIKNSTITENYTDVTSCVDSAKDLEGTNVIINNNYTGIDITSNTEAKRILSNAGFKESNNVYKLTLEATNANINIIKTKEEINCGEKIEVNIFVDGIENITEGINAYQGKFEYNTNIFEKIKETDIKLSEQWTGLVYNQDNGAFVVERKNSAVTGEKIFTVYLQSKENIDKTDTYNVILNDNIFSGGEKDITVTNKIIPIKIKAINKEDEENKETSSDKEESNNEVPPNKSNIDEKVEENPTSSNKKEDSSDKQASSLKQISTNVIDNYGVIQLPHTGIKIDLIIVGLIVAIIICIYWYIKYKKIDY